MWKLHQRFVVTAVFVFTATPSLNRADDICIDWFKESKLKPGPQCLQECTALATGMDTFFCPQHCKELCEQTRCGISEHWVAPHHRRAYYRANKTFVKAEDVKGHCHKNPPSFSSWSSRLKNERPRVWGYNKEQTTKWTPEEIERILDALDETPELLKNLDINGLYRMKKSILADNPATSNYGDVVFYDSAFDSKYVLAHVLAHELAHRLLDTLPKDERKSFAKVAGWYSDTTSGETLRPGRSESQFLRKVGRQSLDEDFADDISAFIHQEKRLKTTAPKVYQWIKDNLRNKFKSGETK
jgi:hypothetical protein